MYTIDFETEAIVQGSDRSPNPVGVAIKHNNQPSIYYSWGHIEGISQSHTFLVSFNAVRTILRNIWATKQPLIFHNAKFDLRICKEYFDLDMYVNVHDTMFMAYLLNPRELSLSLKPLAQKYLDMPPDEQTELKDWILTNVKQAKQNNWGAYIAKAPAHIVGKYAVGDTDRTYALYQYFKDRINETA